MIYIQQYIKLFLENKINCYNVVNYEFNFISFYV